MPDLVLKETGEVVSVSPASLQRALASGLYDAPAGTTTQVSTPQGLLDVPIEQVGQYQQSYGDPTASVAQVGQLEREGYLENRHGGVAGAIGTFAEQAANEATFGLYGLAGGKEYAEQMAERAELHDTAATVGGIAGVVAPALVSGGAGLGAKALASTPAGIASRIGESIVAKGAGRGFAAETAAAVAGYGVEGAMFGSGHVLAESILHDKELSGEAFVAGAKEGAMWGGAGGGAGSLLSRGTKAAKNKLDEVLTKRVELKELEGAHKVAVKEAEREAKELAKLKLQQERALNQRGMEELRQKGRLELVDARGSSKLETIEATTAAKKEVTGYTAEQKLKLEEYRLEGKKELAEIGSEGRLKVAEVGADTRLRIADRQLEKAVAQAEARVAVSRAKLEQTSERLAVEQERTARAGLIMEGRLELADKYTGGWKRAADSREAVAATKLEAAAIGADARTRVGLADAMVRSGRSDAGLLVEEMIPARLRTPKAVAAARSDVVTQAARLQAGTDDLVRQADEMIAASPGAADDIMAMRNAAADSSPAIGAWSERAAAGGDDFAEGFKTIRRAEEAQHDLAQAMRMHSESVGIPAPHLDAVTKGMDDAVGKTDEIITDSIARQVKAAAGDIAEAGVGGAGGAATTDTAAIADLLMGAAGMPNADDIPVIGPVLGAYLKFRAGYGALGKLGIRLPGAVGRIAQVGASVQNKASEVVASLITHAPAAAKVVERAAPSLAATLSRPLWEPLEHDDKDKKVDPAKLYKRRVEELDRALGDPDTTRQRIVDNIPAPPSVANAIADVEMRKMESLRGAVELDPRPPTVMQREARANAVEVKRFSEHKYALENPIDAIADVIAGIMGPRAIEAVKEVFPRLYQTMQEELVEKLSESDVPISFDRLVRAALVFDVPLTPQTRPDYVAARQLEYDEARQAAPAPSPGGGGGQLKLSKQEELGSMRRAMR